MEEAGAAFAGALGGLRTIWAGVVPPASGTPTQLTESGPTEERPAPPLAEAERNLETAAAETAAEEGAAAETAAEVQGKVEDHTSPAPAKPAPPITLQLRIQRGGRISAKMGNYAPSKVAYHPNVRCQRGDGCTCGEGPVIVGPMYRVGKVCVCEGAASEEEKASGTVTAVDEYGRPVEGFDLRSWKAADILGLRGADGTLDLERAILCGVYLQGGLGLYRVRG